MKRISVMLALGLLPGLENTSAQELAELLESYWGEGGIAVSEIIIE